MHHWLQQKNLKLENKHHHKDEQLTTGNIRCLTLTESRRHKPQAKPTLPPPPTIYYRLHRANSATAPLTLPPTRNLLRAFFKNSHRIFSSKIFNKKITIKIQQENYSNRTGMPRPTCNLRLLFKFRKFERTKKPTWP